MALDMSRQRESQLALKSKDGGKYWKPKDGQNVIRVLKFSHKVTKADIEERLFPKSDLGKTVEEWNYPVVMQFGLDPLNRKAPVKSTPETIELYNKLKEEDEEKAQKIRPTRKYAMNIIDLDNPEKGVQIYLAAKSVREFVGDLVIDEDFGESILGAKGRDIKIKYDSKSPDAKNYYKLTLQDKDKSRAINSKIADAVFDLFDPAINAGFVQSREFDTLDAGDVQTNRATEEFVNGKKSGGKKDDIFDN